MATLIRYIGLRGHWRLLKRLSGNFIPRSSSQRWLEWRCNRGLSKAWASDLNSYQLRRQKRRREEKNRHHEVKVATPYWRSFSLCVLLRAKRFVAATSTSSREESCGIRHASRGQ